MINNAKILCLETGQPDCGLCGSFKYFKYGWDHCVSNSSFT